MLVEDQVEEESLLLVELRPGENVTHLSDDAAGENTRRREFQPRINVSSMHQVEGVSSNSRVIDFSW